MIRVLHMIGSLNVGGSQAMVMNLYRKIDRSRVQFDFIIDHGDQRYFADEVEKLGGRIYEMPTFKGTNICQVRKAWKQFFEEHPEYKVLHSHVRSYASIYLPIAKKHGVTTIIHSQSTSNGKGFSSLVKKILQYPLRYQADYFFGCSRIAGEWLFGRNVVDSDRYYMVQNAIDVDKFTPNPIIRERYRNKLYAGNKIVFGHVGRLMSAKNHSFLLDVFSEIHASNADTMLILLGDGQLRTEIEDKVKKLGLQDSVKLLGTQSYVANWLQAMDCFLFPSLWEGLPVTVVEAQAAGLPCFVSDTVTKDVAISELITYLPIDKGAELWSSSILEQSLSRKNVTEDISKAGFNIDNSVAWLTEFYERIWA